MVVASVSLILITNTNKRPLVSHPACAVLMDKTRQRRWLQPDSMLRRWPGRASIGGSLRGLQTGLPRIVSPMGRMGLIRLLKVGWISVGIILERVILALIMLIRYWRNARWQLSPNGRRAREVDDALIADL